MEPSLAGAFEWLARAEEHLDSLEELLAANVGAERLRLRSSLTHHEANGLSSSSIDPRPLKIRLPGRASILVGETALAVRRSLDYLANELVLMDSGKEREDVYFPCDWSKPKFLIENREPEGGEDRSPRLLGLSDEHLLAVGRYQPWSGAKWLDALSKLANGDKHRRLTLTGRNTSIHLLFTDPNALLDDDPMTVTLPFKAFDDGILWWQVRYTARLDSDQRDLVELLSGYVESAREVLNAFRECFDGHCPHR